MRKHITIGTRVTTKAPRTRRVLDQITYQTRGANLVSSGITSPAIFWGIIGSYLLVTMCCRRRRCRRSCVWSRRVFVVARPTHVAILLSMPSTSEIDRQVLLFTSNLTTQPKLPMRLYFLSWRRRVHFHWPRTTTNDERTFERKYPQPTAHIAHPHPKPLIDDRWYR
jgi:hypothetical protein